MARGKNGIQAGQRDYGDVVAERNGVYGAYERKVSHATGQARPERARHRPIVSPPACQLVSSAQAHRSYQLIPGRQRHRQRVTASASSRAAGRAGLQAASPGAQAARKSGRHAGAGRPARPRTARSSPAPVQPAPAPFVNAGASACPRHCPPPSSLPWTPPESGQYSSVSGLLALFNGKRPDM